MRTEAASPVPAYDSLSQPAPYGRAAVGSSIERLRPMLTTVPSQGSGGGSGSGSLRSSYTTEASDPPTPVPRSGYPATTTGVHSGPNYASTSSAGQYSAGQYSGSGGQYSGTAAPSQGSYLQQHMQLQQQSILASPSPQGSPMSGSGSGGLIGRRSGVQAPQLWVQSTFDADVGARHETFSPSKGQLLEV